MENFVLARSLAPKALPSSIRYAMVVSLMEPSARRPRALLSLCFVSLSIAAGCGHPATREECVSIFTKSAELSLREQKVEHPEVIRSRTEQFMASEEGQELIKQCEGKRITESALRCVEKAESAEQIDSCLY